MGDANGGTRYNLRSPSVKRLMQESKELREATEQYHAQPLEDNLYEWHFTIRGAPDTDFADGIYHGRIMLPTDYPMKPPSIVLLTPNGRFEVNKKICLSISGHHPESWQPSWSIRTALMAIIGFLPSPGKGAIGALDYPAEERKKLARRSKEWKCPVCGVENHQLLRAPLANAPSVDEDELLQEFKDLARKISFKGESTSESADAGAARANKVDAADGGAATTNEVDAAANIVDAAAANIVDAAAANKVEAAAANKVDAADVAAKEDLKEQREDVVVGAEAVEATDDSDEVVKPPSTPSPSTPKTDASLTPNASDSEVRCLPNEPSSGSVFDETSSLDTPPPAPLTAAFPGEDRTPLPLAPANSSNDCAIASETETDGLRQRAARLEDVADREVAAREATAAARVVTPPNTAAARVPTASSASSYFLMILLSVAIGVLLLRRILRLIDFQFQFDFQFDYYVERR